MPHLEPRRKHSEFQPARAEARRNRAFPRGRARNSPEMNFGHANLVIAVLLLLLFLRHEFAVAELAYHGYVRTLFQCRRKR